jgi:hypothetical protein
LQGGGNTITPHSYSGLNNTNLFGNYNSWTLTDIEVFSVPAPLQSAPQLSSKIFGSAILENKHQTALQNLIGNVDLSNRLVFRATRDGWNASNFHSKCDNIAPLFLVFKANTNFIATAYTSVAFGGNSRYVRASVGANWLNNLENSNGTISSSKFINNGHYTGKHSIYTEPNSYGPTFGGGHDLWIPQQMNNGGYTNPWSYTGFQNSTLFGNYNSWKLTEIEAYRLN